MKSIYTFYLSVFVFVCTYGQIPISDGFDYPIGNRGFDENGRPVELLEQITEECNNLYHIHPVSNPSRSSDVNHRSAWHNINDVGNYVNPTFTIHPGEDWNFNSGTSDVGKEVYAVANGKVLHIFSTASTSGPEYLGWTIVLKHELPNGDINYSIYTHVTSYSHTGGNINSNQSDFTISENDIVMRGDPIARVAGGMTSELSPHLHFEMRDQRFNGLLPLWPTSTGYYGTGNTMIEVQEAYDLMQEDGIIDGSDFIDRNRSGQINSGADIFAGSTSNPDDFTIQFAYPHSNFTLSGLSIGDNSEYLLEITDIETLPDGDSLHRFTAHFPNNPTVLDNCFDYDLTFEITDNLSLSNTIAYGANQVFFTDLDCLVLQFEKNDLETHYNRVYAQVAALFGLFKGSSQTSFEHGNLGIEFDMNKSEAIKLLFNAALRTSIIDGINTDMSNGSYADLLPCDEAFDYAQTFYNYGFVFDVLGDGMFHPNDIISFGELSFWLQQIFNIQENCSNPNFNCQAVPNYTCSNPDWDNAIVNLANAYFEVNNKLYSIGKLSKIDITADCNEHIKNGDALRLVIGCIIFFNFDNTPTRRLNTEYRTKSISDISDWNVIGLQERSTFTASQSPPGVSTFNLTIKDDQAWTSGIGPLIDNNGNEIHYYWSLIGGNLKSLLPDNNQVIFTPPDVTQAETFDINIWLSNSLGNVVEGVFKITVLDATTDSSSLLKQIEYFIDDDPGYGLGTALSFPPGGLSYIRETFMYLIHHQL